MLSNTGLIPMVVRSTRKAWLWIHLVTAVEGLNPSEGADVRLLCFLFRYWPWLQADHSFKGDIPCV